MNIYIVAFIRNNKIETVVKLTKSKNLAQVVFCNQVNEVKGQAEAELFIKDFSDGNLDDNVTFKVNEELNLQMDEFEIE
jgi:hypothetical protein